MKITASELKQLGVIERIISEDEPVNHETLPKVCENLNVFMREFFETWLDRNEEEIVNRRYDRFRNF